jgi:predicted Zn-dependent protease
MRGVLEMSCAILLAAALAAQGQQAGKPAARTLDARSVLMSWTNEGPAGARTSAVPAGPSAPAQAAANTNDTEESLMVDRAYKMVQMNDLGGAVELFKHVLMKTPDDSRAKFGLGTTYIQMQDYRQALAILEPMSEATPTDYFLKNNIAWLYATAKDSAIRDGAKAVRLAQEALLVAPNDFHVWSTLAEGYYVAGQYDKALRASEEALRIGLLVQGPGAVTDEYRRQVDKCRKAAQAMSVLE